jgi:ribosomal protein S27AE
MGKMTSRYYVTTSSGDEMAMKNRMCARCSNEIYSIYHESTFAAVDQIHYLCPYCALGVLFYISKGMELIYFEPDRS